MCVFPEINFYLAYKTCTTLIYEGFIYLSYRFSVHFQFYFQVFTVFVIFKMVNLSKKGAWFAVFLSKIFCFFHIVWFKVIYFYFPKLQ